MAQQVTVTVDKDGGVKVAVEGCAGPSCSALSADIERALGKVTDDKKTADYMRSSQSKTLNQ